MDKYDVRKQFKELYAPRAGDFEVVSVPLDVQIGVGPSWYDAGH